MVFSSLSPLFIFWAIQGTKLIPDVWFISICVFMVLVPNIILMMRISTAIKINEKLEIAIGTAEDHRDHLLVYLFAMLLPFYTVDLSSYREIATVIVALCFIVFLFWHLNLHYMNIIFAVFGYRVFTVYPPIDGNPLNNRSSVVFITYRVTLQPNERISAYRLSDTVYFERRA